MSELKNGWPQPRRAPIEGRYIRLEPLDAGRHGDGLFAVSTAEGERFRWLFEEAPAGRVAFQPWLERSAASADPLFFAVIDRATDAVAGRQALMRIDPANGVIEIGSIFWSSIVARRPAATEALYLFARHVFDDLGYRRLEWKCNNANTPSKRAALRFGFTFEGVFRQHMVVKGQSRDTAWFSMLDREWPRARAAFEAWLSADNFDTNGSQKQRLEEIRAGTAGR